MSSCTLGSQWDSPPRLNYIYFLLETHDSYTKQQCLFACMCYQHCLLNTIHCPSCPSWICSSWLKTESIDKFGLDWCINVWCGFLIGLPIAHFHYRLRTFQLLSSLHFWPSWWSNKHKLKFYFWCVCVCVCMHDVCYHHASTAWMIPLCSSIVRLMSWPTFQCEVNLVL